MKTPVQIQIPTHRNPPEGKTRGKKFGPEHHAAFEQKLAELFEGFSLQPGLIKGGWVHEGKTYPDTTMAYSVDVAGLIGQGEAVREMIQFAKAHYEQLKIRITYLNVSEVL